MQTHLIKPSSLTMRRAKGYGWRLGEAPGLDFQALIEARAQAVKVRVHGQVVHGLPVPGKAQARMMELFAKTSPRS